GIQRLFDHFISPHTSSLLGPYSVRIQLVTEVENPVSPNAGGQRVPELELNGSQVIERLGRTKCTGIELEVPVHQRRGPKIENHAVVGTPGLLVARPLEAPPPTLVEDLLRGELRGMLFELRPFAQPRLPALKRSPHNGRDGTP